jgi:hypothetical protein
LRDGPRGFGQGFTCPALLRVSPALARHTRTGLSPATAHLSRWFRFACQRLMATLQPRLRRNGTGLGWSPFARRYSGNRCCFLLLRVLRCFSSPGLPPDRSGYSDCSEWVAPFGHPRIKGYVPLPADFRSLSRPSSPLGA